MFGGWCGEYFWYSSFCLHQLQRADPLDPVSGRVLHQLLEADLGLVDAGNDAEVLAHVVALLDPVKIRACLHQGERLLGLGNGAEHLDRLERERLQRLRRALLLLVDQRGRRAGLPAGAGHFDALGAERIDLALGGVGHRLVGPYLRQRVDPPAQILGELVELLLQVAMLLAAAAGAEEYGGERQPAGEIRARTHRFAGSFAERRWAATSSSSRSRKVRATASIFRLQSLPATITTSFIVTMRESLPTSLANAPMSS